MKSHLARKLHLILLAVFIAGHSSSSLAAIDCSVASLDVTNEAVNIAIHAGQIGNPFINQRHVFCGEVNGPNATGFHSTPGNILPTLGNNYGAPHSVQYDDPNPWFPENHEKYTAQGVAISDGLGNFFLKHNVSTMFPNRCTKIQVINSIRYAFNNPLAPIVVNNQFQGPSGPAAYNVDFCYGDVVEVPFEIRAYLNNINGEYIVNTAYPML